jgi:hypothetical protein
LEQFQEIINAGADDDQATQCIGHCVKPVALNEEDIYQGDSGIDEEKDVERLLCGGAMDDLTEHKQVKCELYDRRDAAEPAIVSNSDSEVVLHPGQYANEQEKEGKIPEPALVGGKEKDRQAGQEGDKGRNRDNIYQVTRRSG